MSSTKITAKKVQLNLSNVSPHLNSKGDIDQSKQCSPLRTVFLLYHYNFLNTKVEEIIMEGTFFAADRVNVFFLSEVIVVSYSKKIRRAGVS